eukprot:CAMPEP_0176005704 /NCGR_PEP_ID=MMETSP0120_2-20121206/2343_1 /TAXON_ID=160619 /ORGANISM="Kryptoperidinium foliaceum, Strain CCMP 1326" /LENGTH=164 /DNA_ID=CAMNT_0017338419 /DNA_START=54 /DNA_END=544 /DNA_ORIENTATION=+
MTKLATAAFLLLTTTSQAFQVVSNGSHPKSRAVGPLFAAEFSEPSVAVNLPIADLPNDVPDISAMDLVEEEPEIEVPEVTAEPEGTIVGRVPGSEQALITGTLLGMDTGYKAKEEVTMSSYPKVAGYKKVPNIKCYQTSKGIQSKTSIPLPYTMTPNDLLYPTT